MKKIKAIAMFSGGLDSILSVKLIMDQGVDITGLYFSIPFSTRSEESYILSARETGLELRIIHLKDEFLEVLKNPAYGYGKNINPCIDCRILMLKKAKRVMEEIGASFIITGEVVDQRPMSQNLRALRIIEREADLEGLILRPLSAKLLPLNIPEKEGWVNRENLLGIRGKSRKIQMELAELMDIKGYSSPAGGCLLTDPEFSKRVKDLLDYGDLSLKEVELLKLGRHLRLKPAAKLVVGRDREENDRLKSFLKDGDIALEPTSIPGPIGLLRGKIYDSLIFLSAEIVARYSDHLNKEVEIVYFRLPDSTPHFIKVKPIRDEKLKDFRL